MMTKEHFEALCALEEATANAYEAMDAARQAFEAVVEKYATVLPPIIASSGDPTGMLQAELDLSETQDEQDWEVMLFAGLRQAIMHEDEKPEAP